MYTAGGKGGGGGGRGYFLKGQNFLISPAYYTEIFDNPRSWPALDQKKNRQPSHPVLTRKVKYGQYD